MDYRVAYSRQSLTQGADFFKEVDLSDQFDPGELHRKISRQLTLLGYQIAEENLGIMRRPVGDTVGDVLGILHAVAVTPIPNAGVVVYGLLNKQHVRSILYEAHLRVALSGEYYPQHGRSNLAVMIAGKLGATENLPPRVSQNQKSHWLHPSAKQAYDNMRQKLQQDMDAIAALVEIPRAQSKAA